MSENLHDPDRASRFYETGRIYEYNKKLKAIRDRKGMSIEEQCHYLRLKWALSFIYSEMKGARFMRKDNGLSPYWFMKKEFGLSTSSDKKQMIKELRAKIIEFKEKWQL